MTFFRIFFSQDNIFLAKTEMIASWKIVVIHAYNFSHLCMLVSYFSIDDFSSSVLFFFPFPRNDSNIFLPSILVPIISQCISVSRIFPLPFEEKECAGVTRRTRKLICLFTSLLSGRRKRGWRSNICVRFKVWFDVIGRLVTEFPTRTE